MRRSGLYGMALAGLVLLAFQVCCSFQRPASVQAADAPIVIGDGAAFKPAVLIRIAAIDDLIANARYLAKLTGREELARQVEAMVKARTGAKGLEGIDTKKPIGLYGSVASRIDLSEGMLLLPIADEATFLEFLDTLEYKPTKDAAGLYTLKVEQVPFPIQFRFANGYLYGTLQFTEKPALPAKDKLPLPAVVLSGGGGLLSVTANIDRIPMQIRKIGISAAALTLGNLKEEKTEFEAAVLDEAATQVKTLLMEGGPVMLKVDVDRKKHDLSLSASFAAKPDSTLSKTLAALGQEKSLAAGLSGKNSAMGGFLHASLPASIRKALGPMVDEQLKKLLENLDQNTQDLLAPLVSALKPTLKEGVLDLGLHMRGPSKSGKYTLVGSVQVKDGEGLEKAVKKLVGKLPEEMKKPLTFDVEKADGINIHRIDQDHVAQVGKDLFGEGPLYFAIRKDGVIATSGENALETLKSCLSAQPKAGTLMQLDLSLARIATLLAIQHKTAPEAAKKVFTEKGSDKVRLSLQAGNKLELKLSIKTAALAFAAMLDKAPRRRRRTSNSPGAVVRFARAAATRSPTGAERGGVALRSEDSASRLHIEQSFSHFSRDLWTISHVRIYDSAYQRLCAVVD